MVIRLVIIMAVALTLMAAPATAGYDTGLYAYAAGDFETARREWQALAEVGDARSQYQLGLMHFNGEGDGANDAMAHKWLSKAVEQGYTPALVKLADLFYAGRGGGGHNHQEAARLYGLAAKQGNGDAQYALGALHIRGHGVENDLIQAHMWLSMAGMRGLKIARLRMMEIEAMMTPAQIEQADKLRDERMGMN